MMHREDFEIASNMDEEDQQEFYINTKSGAESGWDFSSRWYLLDGGHNQGNMSHINTRQIVPVDLNAFICMNNRLLSEMFYALGDDEKAQFYHKQFLLWREAINQVYYYYFSLPPPPTTLCVWNVK